MANFGSPPTYYDGAIVILQAADAPVPVPSGQPRPGGFWIKGASYAYTPDSFAVVGVSVPAVHIDLRPAVEAMLDGSDGGGALGDVEPTPGTLLLRDDSDGYGGSGRVTSLFTNDVRPLGVGVSWALRDAAGTAQATVTADGLRVPVLAAPTGAPLSMVDPDLDEFLELDSGGAIARVTDARPFEVRVGSYRVFKLWSTSGAPNPAEFDYGIKTPGIVYGSTEFELGTVSVDRFRITPTTTQILDATGKVRLDDGTPQDLTWATSITPDYSTTRQHIRITAQVGTFTLQNPVNAVEGAEYKVTILAGGGGDNAWGSAWAIAGSAQSYPWSTLTTGVLSGDPGQVMCFTFRYQSGIMVLIAFGSYTP